MLRLSFVLLLSVTTAGCDAGELRVGNKVVVPASKTPNKIVSAVDLSRIGHLAAKGRAQDTDYNRLAVVDDLLANGKECLPYLISKLDDETRLKEQVVDYWSNMTVGDVAFILLEDFVTDTTWTKKTVPGTELDNLLGPRPSEGMALQEYLDSYIKKHGRKSLKAKWQAIWDKYQDRIAWDAQLRYFKLV